MSIDQNYKENTATAYANQIDNGNLVLAWGYWGVLISLKQLREENIIISKKKL